MMNPPTPSGAATDSSAPAPPPTAPVPTAPAGRPAGGLRLLWIASVVIPLAIFTAAALWSWRQVETETRARLARTVEMLHEHALRSLETQEAVLEAADQRVRGMSWEEIARSQPVHEFLSALSRRTQPSGGTVLVEPSGRIAVGSYEFPARPVAVVDREYFRLHRHGLAGTHIGEVIVTRPQNTRVFSISRRRTSGTGGFDGVVVSSFQPSYFEEFYQSVAEGAQDVLALVREDGALLARSPPPPDVSAYQKRLEGQAPPEARAGQAVFATLRSPLDGRDRLYVTRKVGLYPVYVLYGLDAGGIRTTWASQLAVSGAVCALAAVLLLLLTAHAQRAVRSERTALASARAEAERRADAEARLRHSQRVDALGQIVGGVAHDFNNVVMSVMAGVRTIEKRAEDPAQIRRITPLLQSAAERGARLTSRMLAFARREDARTEVVEVRESLKSVCDLLDGTLGAGYRLDCSLPEHLPTAKGDAAEFESVVVNLVINARDATPGGGTVAIRAAEETVDVVGPVHAPGLQTGRYVRVAVSDQGSGMDAATLARAGEAFFTTKEPGRGTGLGLAMARGFAEHAGGALKIDSELGRGTTVTFWLAVA